MNRRCTRAYDAKRDGNNVTYGTLYESKSQNLREYDFEDPNTKQAEATLGFACGGFTMVKFRLELKPYLTRSPVTANYFVKLGTL